MICPQCRRESPAEAGRCVHCGAELAERPATGVDRAEWVELVTVFTTSDESQVLVAHSLLEGEGIHCTIEGEAQGLMGPGRVGSAISMAIGPILVRVRPEDADAARELLAANDLIYTEPEPPAEGPDSGSGIG